MAAVGGVFVGGAASRSYYYDDYYYCSDYYYFGAGCSGVASGVVGYSPSAFYYDYFDDYDYVGW